MSNIFNGTYRLQTGLIVNDSQAYLKCRLFKQIIA